MTNKKFVQRWAMRCSIACIAFGLMDANAFGATTYPVPSLATNADNADLLDRTLTDMGLSRIAWNTSYMSQAQNLDTALLDHEITCGVSRHIVTLEIWDSLTHIAAGRQDDDLRRIARQMRTWQDAHPGHELIVRPLHEANGGWYAWGFGSGNPYGNTMEQFRPAWWHVRGVMRAVFPALPFFWCPNGLINGAMSYADWYPGNDNAEYVGDDGYNRSQSDGHCSWRTPTQVRQETMAAIRAVAHIEKPYIVGETGSSEPNACAAARHSKAEWFRQLAVWMRDVAPSYNVVAVNYFDYDKTTVNGNN